MGNTLSRCCGRESKPPKQKRKSKQSELEIALCERSKIDSYMGLPLADRPKDVPQVTEDVAGFSSIAPVKIELEPQVQESFDVSESITETTSKVESTILAPGKFNIWFPKGAIDTNPVSHNKVVFDHEDVILLKPGVFQNQLILDLSKELIPKIFAGIIPLSFGKFNSRFSEGLVTGASTVPSIKVVPNRRDLALMKRTDPACFQPNKVKSDVGTAIIAKFGTQMLSILLGQFSNSRFERAMKSYRALPEQICSPRKAANLKTGLEMLSIVPRQFNYRLVRKTMPAQQVFPEQTSYVRIAIIAKVRSQMKTILLEHFIGSRFAARPMKSYPVLPGQNMKAIVAKAGPEMLSIVPQQFNDSKTVMISFMLKILYDRRIPQKFLEGYRGHSQNYNACCLTIRSVTGICPFMLGIFNDRRLPRKFLECYLGLPQNLDACCFTVRANTEMLCLMLAILYDRRIPKKFLESYSGQLQTFDVCKAITTRSGSEMLSIVPRQFNQCRFATENIRARARPAFTEQNFDGRFKTLAIKLLAIVLEVVSHRRIVKQLMQIPQTVRIPEQNFSRILLGMLDDHRLAMEIMKLYPDFLKKVLDSLGVKSDNSEMSPPKLEIVNGGTSPVAATLGMNATSIEPATISESTTGPKPENIENSALITLDGTSLVAFTLGTNAASIELATFSDSTTSLKPETVKSPAPFSLDGTFLIASSLGMNAESTDPVTYPDGTTSPKPDTVKNPASLTLDGTSPIASTVEMNAASIEPVTFPDSTKTLKPETVESPALLTLDGTSAVTSTLGINAASIEPATILDSTTSPKLETVEIPALLTLDGTPLIASTLEMNAASIEPAKFSDSTTTPKPETFESSAPLTLDDTGSPIVSTLGMNAVSIEPATFPDSTTSPKPETVERDGTSAVASTLVMNAASVYSNSPKTSPPEAINAIKSKSATKKVLARRPLEKKHFNNCQTKTSKFLSTVKTKSLRRRRPKRHIPYWREKDWTAEADALHRKRHGMHKYLVRRGEDWTLQVERFERKIRRIFGESDAWSWSIEMNERLRSEDWTQEIRRFQQEIKNEMELRMN